MLYDLSALGLLIVLVTGKQLQMRAVMVHTSGENLATFISGVLIAGVTNFIMQLLNINMPTWLPPFITIFTALGSGFATMLGRDLYKSWKAKREAKRKPL